MINNAVIMGRLTADPELRTTGNGIGVCSFTVAVDRNYKPEGEERQTDFINVVVWRKTAGMTQMIRAKWTITVKPVKTVIVEVPKIEPPHYNLPVTDSLKERATAAWNYLRGKGERG